MQTSGCNLIAHSVFKPYASVATSILLFHKGGETFRTLFYRIENDGFTDGAERRPQPGGELEDVLASFRAFERGVESSKPGKVEAVDVREIVAHDYDLAPSVYLSGYRLPQEFRTEALGDLF